MGKYKTVLTALSFLHIGLLAFTIYEHQEIKSHALLLLWGLIALEQLTIVLFIVLLVEELFFNSMEKLKWRLVLAYAEAVLFALYCLALWACTVCFGILLEDRRQVHLDGVWYYVVLTYLAVGVSINLTVGWKIGKYLLYSHPKQVKEMRRIRLAYDFLGRRRRGALRGSRRLIIREDADEPRHPIIVEEQQQPPAEQIDLGGVEGLLRMLGIEGLVERVQVLFMRELENAYRQAVEGEDVDTNGLLTRWESFISKVPLSEREGLLVAMSCGGGGSSGEDCPICFEPFFPTQVLTSLPTCNHQFHGNCIMQWLNKVPTCPLCKRYTRIELLKLLSALSKRHLVNAQLREDSREVSASGLRVGLLEDERTPEDDYRDEQ